MGQARRAQLGTEQCGYLEGQREDAHSVATSAWAMVTCVLAHFLSPNSASFCLILWSGHNEKLLYRQKYCD